MKIGVLLVVLAILALLFFLRPRPDVSGAQARALVQQGARLVDVRSPQEFAGGHLDNAINIPIDELEGRLGELDRSAGVVVYCQSGMRSARAARLLRARGFEKTHDLGAMSAW